MKTIVISPDRTFIINNFSPLSFAIAIAGLFCFHFVHDYDSNERSVRHKAHDCCCFISSYVALPYDLVSARLLKLQQVL